MRCLRSRLGGERPGRAVSWTMLHSGAARQSTPCGGTLPPFPPRSSVPVTSGKSSLCISMRTTDPCWRRLPYPATSSPPSQRHHVRIIATLHGMLTLKAALRLELPMARLLHRAVAIGPDAAAPSRDGAQSMRRLSSPLRSSKPAPSSSYLMERQRPQPAGDAREVALLASLRSAGVPRPHRSTAARPPPLGAVLLPATPPPVDGGATSTRRSASSCCASIG